MKIFIILLIALNYSVFAGSVCGKIAEIRTPMDRHNDRVQSVLVITKTEIFTVVDETVVSAVEKSLRTRLSMSDFEKYLFKQDYLDHLSEQGFSICFDEEPAISRDFPYPLVDKVKGFTIHHKTFVLFNSRRDEV